MHIHALPVISLYKATRTMTSDRPCLGPVFHLIHFAVFIRNGTATCNCLIDVLSKWLFKT